MNPTTLSIVLLFVLISTGVAEAAPVAKVNGVEITEAMFEAFTASRTQKPVAELTAEERELLSEELIKLVAIGSEARKKKIQNNPEIAAQLELQTLSFLAQAYVQRQLDENPVSADNLQQLYDSKYGSRPVTEYKARHILVASQAVAQDIIGQLDAGGNFVELAAKHSTGPSANSGGDLGWFTSQQMVPEFANAVANLSAGSHTKAPVQTQYGWHVILKEDQRESPPPELAAVRQDLQRELQQNEIRKLVDGLRDAAKVKIYQ